jgi:hypothetical protein
MDTQAIFGVEIFAVGTWNGDEYTHKDLDDMVQAFKDTSQTIKPPLKLGHDDNQTILQQSGLPAAGWISNLYVKGGKLLADFIDIPNKVYDLLEKGAYKKVSAEIWWNASFNGRTYPKFLSGVALLGSEIPAVITLTDILGMYSNWKADIKKHYAFNTEALIIKKHTLDRASQKGDKMEKTEIEKKLEQDLETEKKKASDLESQIKTFQTEVTKKDLALSELEKFKSEAHSKALEAEKALEDAKLERTLSELQNDKLISQSMKPYVKALLAEDKKEYSVTDKKFSKPELLKEILKLYSAASAVNFSESSVDEKKQGEKDEKVLNDKIADYAREHKVSYSAAYRAVMKEKKSA